MFKIPFTATVCVCVSAKKRGFIEANKLQSIMKLTSCCEREKAPMIFSSLMLLQTSFDAI
jgi:hypothetical protein